MWATVLCNVQIPGFVLHTRLYQGEATIVYAGVCEADGRPVVGKMVTGGARDLRAELALLQKLRGAGIVEALGVFDSSDGPVLVQRRFGDGSLDDALSGGPLSLERALSIAQQLALVLARIHAMRVIHRDIKPANVLFDRQSDAIALADFGTAAELPVQARVLPVSDLIGTPAYLAPEQTGRTHEGVDARSDLYAFGVLLYELLTGTRPFSSSDLLELVSAHLSKVPEPPNLRNPAVPQVVSAIVMKLLAKGKEQRYQSARGLAVDLARCLQTLSADSTIPSFELGLSDLARPRLTGHIYGREREREAFGAALARARSGKPTLLLVTGREGAGRGGFVDDALRTGAPDSACGKGSFKSADERPLAGISDALGALAGGLLLLDDRALEQRRAALSARLGKVGQVLVDIAPALADVLGPQPPLAELGPAEARGRLRHAFRSLARALAGERPFVLSLDGFERADAASRSLVESLLDEAEGARILVVLSARDAAAFGALREHPVAQHIELGPLGIEALTEWTAAMLDCAPSRAAELAAVLHERSAGNPGMFLSLVDHFVDLGVIERSEGAFRWSLEEVRTAKAPASIGALAAQRVAELAPDVQRLLAAVAVGDAACTPRMIAAMVEAEREGVEQRLTSLAREGLVEPTKEGGFALAHEAIAKSVLSATPPPAQAAMRARLGVHLLRTLDDGAVAEQAFRIASALGDETELLTAAERPRAAALLASAMDQATAMMAYDRASAFAERGGLLLGDDGWTERRALVFRLAVGRARSLMMLAQHEQAEHILKELCDRELTAEEIGKVYPSRADNRSVVMDRTGAIDIGLEGLARLGFPLPAEPTQQEALAPLIRNQQVFAKMSPADHAALPLATDDTVLAAQTIISTLSGPLGLAGRGVLLLLALELALELSLKRGHTRYYASYLATHAMILHSRLGSFDAARAAAEACEAVQAARPSPEIDGRTFLVLYYLVYPWLGPWHSAKEPLAKGMQFAVEAGDPLFAALCASASITLMAMCGEPLDRIVAAIEGFGSILKADGGVAVNAGNVHNIAGKLSRGEPIETADLERVTNVSKAAGSMRNNAMVNLGLALMVIGHETQVRTWFEEVRTTFPQVNSSQPHLATVWLLDGIFAAKDRRVADAERALASLRKLAEQTKSGNHEPAIVLLEAELAQHAGELDRASGLYGRAASEARTRALTHVVAYAMEQRAQMLEQRGYADEAALFYRESAIAYRRWGNFTKVRQLERLHPALQTLEPVREAKSTTRHRQEGTRGATRGNEPQTGTLHTHTHTHTTTINESLDLGTVLKISQEISTQLHASEVARAVLMGIAQNAGAERVLLILRTPSGDELVYGEAHGASYRDIGVPLADYAELPESVLRLARRTERSLIVADAGKDPAHAADPFVVRSRCRSIAVIPFHQKGALAGFVLLENRLASGAFTPQLVTLTQSLVAQAAISLDNASLYENMESRVRERTAALNARNEEMRLVLDNVSQGLVMADRTGRLSAERSAILGRWFPEGVPETLAEIFASEAVFGLSWEQLTDGFLPLELCLDQLPKHLRRGEQIFELNWRPIMDEHGEMVRMLLVMSDITEALRRQEAEQEQKEMMAIFERLSQDRGGVIEFAREAANIVRELEHGLGSSEVEKRLVHTLKGNAALFGLGGLSALCHDIESALVLDTRGLSPEERAEICAAWHAIDARLSRFLTVGSNYVQVARPDFEAALRALVREGSPVAQDLELWKLETLESRFQRIGEQAQGLAKRLGKAPLQVQVEHAGIRINSDLWAPVWAAFVHAVRNAVDHGLEPADERAAEGKGMATVRLRAYFSGPNLQIEFSDDGRGIAWERVREKAQSRGLPAETRADLVSALFDDGFSTKESADENSGRGVGMSALRDACAALDATIDIDSTPGVGTTLRFTFPGHLARLPRERRSLAAPSLSPPN